MEKKNIYETPEAILVDFQAEGILCGSLTQNGGGGIGNLNPTDGDLFN